MIENAEKMSCGNCGEEKHKIYWSNGRIITECCKCGNLSKINIIPASLTIDWVENQDGLLSR